MSNQKHPVALLWPGKGNGCIKALDRETGEFGGVDMGSMSQMSNVDPKWIPRGAEGGSSQSTETQSVLGGRGRQRIRF